MQLLRVLALLILTVSLAELPRDLHFCRLGLAQDPPLVVGMTIKIGSGLLAAGGVFRAWKPGFALLLVWCFQGALIAAGEWLGQGFNLPALASLLARGLVLWLGFKARRQVG